MSAPLTQESFRGSWAGLPLAWTADDDFDEQTYRGDVARCCRLQMPGVYTGGTTGEFYALEFDDFKRVTRATVQEAHAGGKPAMIGVTATSTRGAERRAAYAAEAGADAIQAALPFWLEVPDDAVTGFFQAVSAASGHLPLSLYATPRAKKDLALEHHRRIKEALPNYLMVKAAGRTVGTTEEGCAALTALGIRVFADEGTTWERLAPHGVAGCCSAFVYYVPDLVLPLNRDLAGKNLPGLAVGTAKLRALLEFLVTSFRPRGYFDSAIDRIGGVAGGVLRTSLRCQRPYAHGASDDVRLLREWYRKNLPEIDRAIDRLAALP
jgi:dihydrodipicolinate synthase/N-acetylneuraminate lyase